MKNIRCEGWNQQNRWKSDAGRAESRPFFIDPPRQGKDYPKRSLLVEFDECIVQVCEKSAVSDSFPALKFLFGDSIAESRIFLWTERFSIHRKRNSRWCLKGKTHRSPRNGKWQQINAFFAGFGTPEEISVMESDKSFHKPQNRRENGLKRPKISEIRGSEKCSYLPFAKWKQTAEHWHYSFPEISDNRRRRICKIYYLSRESWQKILPSKSLQICLCFFFKF